jgi:predicted DCC family thiol-disulfide oxidoreductase YuxK
MGLDSAPVLLYDGECGLCNALIRFLMRRDRGGRLRYAPLQSAPAQAYLRAHGLPTQDFSSLVLVDDWEGRGPGRFKTDGAIGAFEAVGGPLRIARFLRIIPRPLRDAAYSAIARVRYAIFGAYVPRPLEDPSWESRFVAH